MAQVKLLCRLYRQVTIDLSQARASGEDPADIQHLNNLAARAHGQVYRAKRVSFYPLFHFVVAGFAQTIRRNWRPIGIATAIFLLTTVASAVAVVRDPELAYSLFDEGVVEHENIRLEKQEGEYKGNFTFSIAESPFFAAVIITHNVLIAIGGFALGSLGCVLGVFLLIYNGRMLGTLSGMLWNGGYFIGFYSLIMTHGVLELSAICISMAGGFKIGWAVIAPGRLGRADAIRQSARDAFGLLGGSILMLVVAGTIEAYVTPHCSASVRWSVAITTAVAFAAYVAFAGNQGNPRSASAS